MVQASVIATFTRIMTWPSFSREGRIFLRVDGTSFTHTILRCRTSSFRCSIKSGCPVIRPSATAPVHWRLFNENCDKGETNDQKNRATCILYGGVPDRWLPV